MLRKRWFSVVVAVTYIIQTQGADKYTDKNRPYEFGFKIGSEQHRHEKKDENGIVMGEFGFLTADGVYHVTVYATDENGKFKILSMKNIRVKPYPTASEKKGHSLPFPPSQNPPQTQGPSPRTPTIVPAPSPPNPARSCSSCSLPTTTTAKPPLTDLAVVSRDQPGSLFSSFGAVNPQYPQDPQQKELSGNQPPIGTQNYPQDLSVQTRSGFDPNYSQQDNQYNQNYPQGIGGAQEHSEGNQNQYNQNYPQGTSGAQEHSERNQPQDFQKLNSGENQPSVDSQNYPLDVSVPTRSGFGHADHQHDQTYPQNVGGLQEYPKQPNVDGIPFPEKTLQTPFSQPGGERSPKQLANYPQEPAGDQGSQFIPEISQGNSKPILISAQMQIVDKNTDVNYKKPGESDGLPNGLTKDNMLKLLYIFNYTLGFHGHYEEGYTNGAKKGYYYVTGRNGVKTRVDYVADENGFRPKITQEVLDILSDDVPKPETEREEKYGLKGYEFKWLYYPVESKT